MSRRALYSVTGALLALGAPLGLLLLEAVRAGRVSGSWLFQELGERTADTGHRCPSCSSTSTA
jgi:hypothetical protein